MQQICVREPVDQVWDLKIWGNIPSLAGCVIVVHDTKGQLITMQRIPHGTYPQDAPFVWTVPKDGITGDYRIIVVGSQEDFRGINLPVTNLPFEVYGSTNFAKHSKNPLWFKAPPDVKELEFSGHGGTLQVIDSGGGVVAETAKSAEYADYMTVAKVALKPDKIYGLKPVSTYYMMLQKGGKINVAFDPAKLFNPDPQLVEVPWWRLTDQKFFLTQPDTKY